MSLRHLESVKSVAIVGATGLVAKEFLEILEEYKIKIPHIKLLASERSEGEVIAYGGDELVVEKITPESFRGMEVAFFSAPAEVSRKFAPSAIEAGAIVIDDSNAFRMMKEVPLVVPQINGELLSQFKKGIVATPNCTTTPLTMILKPLSDAFGLTRVVASTYQAISGAGSLAMETFSKQTVDLMSGKETENDDFAHRMAFNCIPMIGPVLENGNSEEEQKVIEESKKILGLPDLLVSATSVRVPVFNGHGLSVNVELKKPFESIEQVREILESFEGVRVVDNSAAFIFPTNEQIQKTNETFVGRIRRDASLKSGINFWVMADNLRKGAALNALETLDMLFGYKMAN